jgi:hypothetical protein
VSCKESLDFCRIAVVRFLAFVSFAKSSLASINSESISTPKTTIILPIASFLWFSGILSAVASRE